MAATIILDKINVMEYTRKYPVDNSGSNDCFIVFFKQGDETSYYALPYVLAPYMQSYKLARAYKHIEILELKDKMKEEGVDTSVESIYEFIAYTDIVLAPHFRAEMLRQGIKTVAAYIATVVNYTSTGVRLPLFLDELKYN